MSLHEATKPDLHGSQQRNDSSSNFSCTSEPNWASSQPDRFGAGSRDKQLADVVSDEFHSLLLLSDSALPLGSFAFSSGLESFLAHQPLRDRTAKNFNHFLTLSLSSLKSTSLPYVVAAFREPARLFELDNDFDASTTCSVARRASVKQGRALVTVWERSFRPNVKNSKPTLHVAEEPSMGQTNTDASINSMNYFCTALKTATDGDLSCPNGHLAPLFGVLSSVLQIPLHHALYIFLLNHTKALVSAAIRASVCGPYQAQMLLAGANLRENIRSLVHSELEISPRSDGLVETQRVDRVDQAGQSVPMLDLWGGRHEIVYSRIFNS